MSNKLFIAPIEVLKEKQAGAILINNKNNKKNLYNFVQCVTEFYPMLGISDTLSNLQSYIDIALSFQYDVYKLTEKGFEQVNG